MAISAHADERPPTSRPHDVDRQPRALGLVCGLAAYALWGVLPIYFKALAGVPPIDIVAHRIVWSLAVAGRCW